jgi:hypothetical protein
MKKTKYIHATDTTEELIELRKNVRTYIFLAQYKKAYKYLLKKSLLYPSSYYIASMLATLNTEEAFLLPEKEKKKAFKLAAKKMKKLLYSTKGCEYNLKARNINEYYWFSQQHKKQYDFGVKCVKNGDLPGLYSQGVGAANYAYKLMLKGKINLSLKWAEKSQLAWEEYFKKVEKNYHDPWYWYALALGLQGKKVEMLKAMNNSAKLSKLNVDKDPSFKKLRQMIKSNDK